MSVHSCLILICHFFLLIPRLDFLYFVTYTRKPRSSRIVYLSKTVNMENNYCLYFLIRVNSLYLYDDQKSQLDSVL